MISQFSTLATQTEGHEDKKQCGKISCDFFFIVIMFDINLLLIYKNINNFYRQALINKSSHTYARINTRTYTHIFIQTYK